MTARDEILAQVRRGLGAPVDPPSIPREYRTARDPARSPALIDRFCERVAAYRATVRSITSAQLGATIAGVCRSRGTTRLYVPSGHRFSVPGLELVADRGGVPLAHLGAAGALTGCALAIAQTGTIVLDGGPHGGRRALTLVPDHHVCVVREEQILDDVPDAIAILAPAAAAGRPITLISGPSATSDIELERVEGVHGPRQLDVVVLSS